MADPRVDGVRSDELSPADIEQFTGVIPYGLAPLQFHIGDAIGIPDATETPRQVQQDISYLGRTVPLEEVVSAQRGRDSVRVSNAGVLGARGAGANRAAGEPFDRVHYHNAIFGEVSSGVASCLIIGVTGRDVCEAMRQVMSAGELT